MTMRLSESSKANESPIAPAPGQLLQRTCACGNHAPGGECEACRRKRLAQRPADRFIALPPTALHMVGAPGLGLDFSTVSTNTALRPLPGKAKAWPTDDKGVQVPSLEPEEAMAGTEGPEEEEGEEGAAPASSEATTTTATPAAEALEASEPDVNEWEESKPKAKVEFEVVHTVVPFSGVWAGKTMCPAPRNAPVNFNVRRSTAAQRAAMGPCIWGITEPDPLQVTTRTCRDGADWRLRVRRVRSVIRTFSRQLPGQVEPTVGNSTAANFCTQVTELDALGNCPGNFYMLAAVRAHERVHLDEWRTSMGSDWPAQQAIIDGLNVPAAGATRRRSAATTAMRSSAAFTNAIQTSRASGNYPAFWGIPDPNANTDAAERVIVAPRIRQLCVNARNRGWGPAACPVCVNNGIT